ncbi:MAG: hypothetical protein NTW96_08530 [Planctomycetia bacterium]|nr:hypothetical protein [Planctomycetia bacterium]
MFWKYNCGPPPPAEPNSVTPSARTSAWRTLSRAAGSSRSSTAGSLTGWKLVICFPPVIVTVSFSAAWYAMGDAAVPLSSATSAKASFSP